MLEKSREAVLVGHKRVRELLDRLYSTDQMPGTLLFSGPAGVGKAVAARELARGLLCTSIGVSLEGSRIACACGVCSACQLVLADSHPDLYSVDGHAAAWRVDSIRELLAKLHMAAYEHGNRVVIIDNVEALGEASLNVLLKALEEPRKGVFFILVSSSIMKIPPTVRSRCVVVQFGRLSAEEVGAVIARTNNVSDAALSRISRLVDGTVGDAHLVLKYEEFDSELEGWLSNIFKGSSKVACDLANILANEKDSLRERLGLVRLHVIGQVRSRGLAAAERRAWSTCLANIIEAERLIFDRSVNPAQVLVPIFLGLSNRSDLRIFERS